jgi:hypothetical protein
MVVVSKENGDVGGGGGIHAILSAVQRRAAAMFGTTTSRQQLRNRSASGLTTSRSCLLTSVVALLVGLLLYEWAWTYWLPGALMTSDTEVDWERGRTVTRRRPDLLTRTDPKDGTVRAKYVCGCVDRTKIANGHCIYPWVYISLHSCLMQHAARFLTLHFLVLMMNHCAPALMLVYTCPPNSLLQSHCLNQYAFGCHSRRSLDLD